MVLLFITTLYVCLALSVAYLLPQLSIVAVVGFIYILPILMEFFAVSSKYFITDKKLLRTSVIVPILSTLYYLIFAYQVSSTGEWLVFVDRYTSQTSEFTIEISPNLMEGSQLVFVILLYFSVSGLTYLYRTVQLKK